MWGPFGWFFGSTVGIIGFIISLAIYFLPTIIAWFGITATLWLSS
jgi:hypothetical protein